MDCTLSEALTAVLRTNLNAAAGAMDKALLIYQQWLQAKTDGEDDLAEDLHWWYRHKRAWATSSILWSKVFRGWIRRMAAGGGPPDMGFYYDWVERQAVLNAMTYITPKAEAHVGTLEAAAGVLEETAEALTNWNGEEVEA